MDETTLLAKSLRESSEVVATRFTAPDDDWEQVALIEGGRGPRVVMLRWSDVAEKELAVDALLALAAAELATHVGFVLSSWKVIVKDWTEVDKIVRRGGVAKDERRVECLIVHVLGKRDTAYWEADIVRDETLPPKLGPWHHFPDARAETRFDRIREVLRDVSPEVAARRVK